jgi:hypothetical protein
MKTATLVMFALLAAACVRSTGIIPAGPDTYLVTDIAPLRGGWASAQKPALNEANAFCAQQDKVFVPVEMGTDKGETNYSVAFRCLPADHPDVAGFRLGHAPNYIIEERNR